MPMIFLSKGAARWLLDTLKDEYPGDEGERHMYPEAYGFVDGITMALEFALKEG